MIEKPKFNLEFVCTGNNGRSTLSSAAAQALLRENCDDDIFQAISSGTHVDAIMQGTWPIALKKKTFVSGAQYGIFDPSGKNEALVKYVLEHESYQLEQKCFEDNDFSLEFNNLVEISRQYYAKDEESHCLELAKDLWIEPYLDGNFKQTRPNEQTVAIFTMGASNLTEVQRIYDQAGCKRPLVMDVISKYVGGQDAKDIPNTFAQGRDAYRKMAEILLPMVVDATEKFVWEHNQG